MIVRGSRPQLTSGVRHPARYHLRKTTSSEERWIMTKGQGDEAAIRGIARRAFEAERKMDLDALMRYYADDVIVQLPNMQQLEGKEALREFYAGFLKAVVEIEGGPRRVIISKAGDMAYAIGANRIVLEGPAGRIEDEGKTMSVWRKKDGEWEIVAISASSNKPAS
jgi:uncharacterized protein (TIGR02246 family)